MKTSGIDRLLTSMGITAPPVATGQEMAPILDADYHLREFAREAAQRISKKFGLDEDTVFWLITDERPEDYGIEDDRKEWIGVMIPCDEPFIGKVKRPGWGCPICGWRIGMIEKPVSCYKCGFIEK